MIKNRVGVARFPGSAVEVEILRRTLLEPQPVVVGRVLKKFRGLLEQLLAVALVPLPGSGPGILGRLPRRVRRSGTGMAGLGVGLFEVLAVEEIGSMNSGLLAYRIGLMRHLEVGLGSKLGRRRLIVGTGELVLKGPAVAVPLVLVIESPTIGRLHRFRELIHVAVFGSLNSPHWPQRLALRAFDFAGIRAAPALEV
jgi:hypothetical protein